MRIVTFQPRPSPGLELVKDYGQRCGDDPLRRAAGVLSLALRGQGQARCRQTSWMGRGCFVAVTPTSFLSAKGTGPGPGSEALRVALDAALRADGEGEGGCVRLETDRFYPLLVPFRQRDGRWEVVDPRPEGFSMLALLVRDAESGAVYQAIGVPTLAPLLLLRRSEPSPWGVASHQALARYLAARLPQAIRTHLNTAVERPITFCGLTYCHLDGGVLIRAARSPFRVANLQRAAATCDRRFLRYLTVHALGLWRVGDRSLTVSTDAALACASRFLARMARSAAALFAEGVLHNRLGQQHQNITLAAEIADLDAGLFLRTLPWPDGEPPFASNDIPPRRRQRAPIPRSVYAQFWANLRDAEGALGVGILRVIDADTKRLAGLCHDGREGGWRAAAMLRQLFDLSAQAMRAADLLHRTLAASPDAPGTILPTDVHRKLLAAFTSIVARELARRRSLELLAWACRHGYDLLMYSVAESDTRTIHGWSHADSPVEHLRTNCDQARTDRVMEEARTFFTALRIAAAIDGRSESPALRAGC